VINKFMKNDLIKYLEYEKNTLNVNEEDFLCILNKIELVRPVAVPSNFTKMLKSPVYAWSFGFSGVIAAMMMFILTDITNDSVNKTQLGNIVAYNQITEPSNTLSSEKAKAIKVIDSIDSFANNSTE
jgi:hypothetical protein